jgi:LppP/LprE lipoprotein
MTSALAVAAVVTLFAAGGAANWLDAKTPANWNVAGAAVPARPGPRDAELAAGGRCASTVRPPTSPEDRALVQRGWSLVGPYERYGGTVAVTATSGADGMCRPLGYQAFVFVNGKFAGTLSPRLMDSRTDGSIASVSVTLFNATDLEVEFARYGEQDALCCPHATTTVEYTVTAKPPPRVAPASITTTKNAP